MKSKSFDLKQGISEKKKHNKSFDFIGYYKSVTEINAKLTDKRQDGEGINKENNFIPVTKPEKSKRERSPKKKVTHEPLDVTEINIDGRNLNASLHKNSPRNDSKLTSTPSRSNAPGVKSIMKNTPINGDDSMDGSHINESSSKRKKRNKSVSFMLDDSDAVATKKTKSDNSLTTNTSSEELQKDKDSPQKDKEKHFKKHKVKKTFDNNTKMDTDTSENQVPSISDKKLKFKDKGKSSGDTTMESSSDLLKSYETQERKKKLKKLRKQKSQVPTVVESESNNEDQTENKEKKKKKKRSKSSAESDGEPQTKSRKREAKADIAEDLENLSIGDNTHTLTNLLDEMTVVDKEKKKKIKHKSKKDKKPISNTDKTEIDNSETTEEKEKVKWRNRKWNKDRRGERNEHGLETSVIVDNLPLSIMLTYRKLLTEHFEKCGAIKKIGIAEVYPTEESKPVFTTTIHFDNAEAATKALEEDNTAFEGSRIRVKRPLEATLTTLVVRSYAELSDQNVSSVFIGAGRIRSIKHLVKGKKSIATTFIEFDGPETVEKALKIAKDARIGGKKIHVAKFEHRVRKNKKKIKHEMESENEGDSENSND